ncbi:MAG: cysteine synthase [Haloplasmataceae bacterium]|nr:cysteine synthase [Haloplasmataceae bacterium]
MIYSSIDKTIGNTPIIKLDNLPVDYADVFVKLEFFNPGGSVKDRIALKMITAAEENGEIKPGDTIIEPTSGNTGIGVAMIGAAKGYRIVLCMPETMSIERRKILKAFGAELVLTEGPKGMKGAIAKAEELQKEYGYFMLKQFDNNNNVKAHEETTALELLNDFPDGFDAFVSGVGTGGTITGVGNVVKQKYPNIHFIAVEPVDSPVLSGGKPGPHKIQGIGAGFVPSILNPKVYDEIFHVTTENAFNIARKLAKEYGILVGISSGAAVFAALETAKKIGKGKKVVVIAPDNGERYLSTALFEVGE